MKKTRRAGRPASTKEDLLRIKIAALEEEYTKGFCRLFPFISTTGKSRTNIVVVLPDVTSAENVKLLDGWEGSWVYLTTIPWIKVTNTGNVRKSEPPSKALN